MSTDFELFPKNLSGLFKDIYDNQQNKSRISELIGNEKVIRHSGDMAVIGPIIKD